MKREMALGEHFVQSGGPEHKTKALLHGKVEGAPIIELKGVSKLFRIWSSPSARLNAPILSKIANVFPDGSRIRERLHAKASSLCRDFYAVSNIDLTLHRGDSVAIIGRNGAGKSTLLQMIAGTLQATFGSLAVRGRVAALLELGSGFNPEFTGRENVYLNASILGLSRAEIDERFQSIVEFAEIGDYLDQPVKTYSSGMVMRLAFAVQTAIEPDVLIVDEALSVGDSLFQAKCMMRMKRMLDKGLTLLFVTHDVSIVPQFCKKALYLRGGQARLLGASSEVVNLYLRDLQAAQAKAVRALTPNVVEETREASAPQDAPTFKIDDGMEDRARDFRYGSGRARVRAIELIGADGEPALSFSFREKITVRAYLELYGDVERLNCCLLIRNRLGVELLHCTSREYGHQFPRLSRGSKVVVDIAFENILKAGQGYSVSYTVNDTETPETQEILDLIELAAAFEVRHDPNNPIYYLVWHPFDFNHVVLPVERLKVENALCE